MAYSLDGSPLQVIQATQADRTALGLTAVPDGMKTSTLFYETDTGLWYGGAFASPGGARGWAAIGSAVGVYSSNVNGVVPVWAVSRYVTTGTPANGIGAELIVAVQTGATQANTIAALKIDAVVTDVVAGSTKADFKVSDAGTGRTALELIGGPTSGQTAAFLLYHNGTALTLQQVTVGAADSGGTGFKLLRVPN